MESEARFLQDSVNDEEPVTKRERERVRPKRSGSSEGREQSGGELKANYLREKRYKEENPEKYSN